MKQPLLPYFRATAAIAAALIMSHVSGCEDNTEPEHYNDAGNVSALTVSPGAKSLGAADTSASFAAGGGSPPYSWSVSDTSLGTVADTTFSIVTYSRVGSTEGVNVVRVTDANGWVAEAVVTQDQTP